MIDRVLPLKLNECNSSFHRPGSTVVIYFGPSPGEKLKTIFSIKAHV